MKLPPAIENLLQRLGIQPSGSPSAGERRKSELGRLAVEQKAIEEESIARFYKKLLQEAASPLSQLILQLHLAGKKDAALTAADVLVHVKRLITLLEENGMVVVGQPGEILPFDPSLHEPADSIALEPSTPIQIRFPGIAYCSSVLRKAAVDRQEVD